MIDTQRISARAKELRDVLKVAMLFAKMDGEAMLRDVVVAKHIQEYALSEHKQLWQALADLICHLWAERDDLCGQLFAAKQKPIQLESSIKPEGHVAVALNEAIAADRRVIYGDKSPKFNGVPITAEKAKEILDYDKEQLAAIQAKMQAQIAACAKSQFQADEPEKEEEPKPIRFREFL